jgi:hypothetical protein
MLPTPNHCPEIVARADTDLHDEIVILKPSGRAFKLTLADLLPEPGQDHEGDMGFDVPDPKREHELRQASILTSYARVSPALARVFERCVPDSKSQRTVFVPLPVKR